MSIFTLPGIPSDLLNGFIFNKRRIKVESSSSSESAYGESLVASSVPIMQISASAGISNEVITVVSDDSSLVVNDGMYVATCGASQNSLSSVSSSREIKKRPGQGLSCIISGRFSVGSVGVESYAGFITSESIVSFAVVDGKFGVVDGFGGQLSIHELDITSGATSDGTASITINSIVYIVNITSSSINNNAFEICKSLSDQVDGFRFSSNGSMVTIISNSPVLGFGSFDYTSTVSIATLTEVNQALLPTRSFTDFDNFSEDHNVKVNHLLLNEYKIQFDGDSKFYIKDYDTGGFVLVHKIPNLNVLESPKIKNPSLRVGWAVVNYTGSESSSVYGNFCAGFIEGDVVYEQLPKGDFNVQDGVGSNLTNVISFRNRLNYNGNVNRIELKPLILSLGTDSSKPVLFKIIANPVTNSDEFIDWGYKDKQNSIMESSKNPYEVIGGDEIITFVIIGTSEFIDMSQIVNYQPPGSEFSICAQITQGNVSSMIASGTWKEDQ